MKSTRGQSIFSLKRIQQQSVQILKFIQNLINIFFWLRINQKKSCFFQIIDFAKSGVQTNAIMKCGNLKFPIFVVISLVIPGWICPIYWVTFCCWKDVFTCNCSYLLYLQINHFHISNHLGRHSGSVFFVCFLRYQKFEFVKLFI